MENKDLEIKVGDKVEDYSITDKLFEIRVVHAHYKGKEIGHITVMSLIKGTKEELESSFFRDFSFKPAKPRPYVFFLTVDDEFRGNKIAGKLIEVANDFYKSEYGTPLHSTTALVENSRRVWERLVEEGKAKKCEYKGIRMFEML